jgi:hypothetical protein
MCILAHHLPNSAVGDAESEPKQKLHWGCHIPNKNLASNDSNTFPWPQRNMENSEILNPYPI